MRVADIFETLEYGPAPESAAPALEWIERHGPAFKLFINGQWVEAQSGETFQSINPSTGKPLAKLASAGQVDVDAAVEAAREAFGHWRATPGHVRARYLYAIARHMQKHSRLLAVLEIDGQRQAHPRDARHRHAAGGAPLLPPRRLGAVDGERVARLSSRWASSGRSSPGTSRC